MSILEKVKEHPALTVGAIVGVLVIVYVLNHSGGSPAATASLGGGSSVDAATGYQQAQLAASSDARRVDATVRANADSIAGQIALAQIGAQQSGAHDQLAAQVATSEINASQQLQSLLASYSLEGNKAKIAADLATTGIVANSQIEQQKILASGYTNIAEINARTQVAQTQINADTTRQGYSTTLAISGINAETVRQQNSTLADVYKTNVAAQKSIAQDNMNLLIALR